MNKHEMIACVTALADAKNCQNIPRILEIYHPAVEMITPAFASHAYGRAETSRQLGYFFRLFPDYTVSVSDYTQKADVLLANGIVTMTPNTTNGTARNAKVRVTMAFEFKDNAISKEIFNIDLAEVAAQAGILLDDLLGK